VHLCQRPTGFVGPCKGRFVSICKRKRGRRQLTLFIHVCWRAVARCRATAQIFKSRASECLLRCVQGGRRSAAPACNLRLLQRSPAVSFLRHAFILRNELYIVWVCARERVACRADGDESIARAISICSFLLLGADGTFNQNAALQSNADAVLCSAAAFFRVCVEWPGISRGICIYQYIVPLVANVYGRH
jgi:hypothetical protein